MSIAKKRRIDRGDVNRFRFWFQIGAFVLLVYGGYWALDISTSLPTFSCVFSDSRGGTCYLYPLQHQVNMSWKQFASPRAIGMLTALGTFVCLFLLFNKAWCGFACPLGTVQDWMTKLRLRTGIRPGAYTEVTFNRLKVLKYVLLVLLILLPLGISNSLLGLPKFSRDVATSFCMLCPGRTVLPVFTGDFSQLTIDFSSRTMTVLTALGMAVFGTTLVGAFYKKRFFCLFCPMSALHYVFSKGALLGLKKDGAKCTRCGNCYHVCDMGIREIADDLERRNIVQDDCMMCFKCVAACPEEGCLKVTVPGLTIYQSTEEGFFTRSASRLNHER